MEGRERNEAVEPRAVSALDPGPHYKAWVAVHVAYRAEEQKQTGAAIQMLFRYLAKVLW